MNKRQAYEAGYEFHGCWERSYNKDIVKEKAKELRKAGNKAVMVSDDGGYGVYWIESEENIAAREKVENERKRVNIQRMIEKKKAEIAEYEAQLAELEGK